MADSRPDVVVLDYGSGNVRSAVRAVERAGARVELTADPDRVMAADGLVVPGVGAFASCVRGLEDADGKALVEQRLAAGQPVLGICVGMQILFELGVEHGVVTPGLGQWPGTVEALQARPLPHMGWSEVEVPAGSRLFTGVEAERFYFVHSYGVRTWPSSRPTAALTWSEHGGDRFVAAVEEGPLSATQFHPEKSGDAGARLLSNWLETL